MVKAAEHIDLTSALTLAAFGVETKDDEFAVAMNVDHFGMERVEAGRKFSDALKRLQQAVLAGGLELIGKYEPGRKTEAPILSAPIPAHTLHDYAAFDYKVNGLRHGSPQLLWFPDGDQGYVQPVFTRTDYYSNIKVMRGQIRKFLGTGKSPAQQARNNPSLSEADLKKWYRALKPTEQGLPIDKLVALAKDTHPTRHVSRQAVRRVIGSRRRGRPKKSAT